MEPRSDTESVVDKIRRGEISALDAFAAELPEVFAAEILPKLARKGHSQTCSSKQAVQGHGVE